MYSSLGHLQPRFPFSLHFQVAQNSTSLSPRQPRVGASEIWSLRNPKDLVKRFMALVWIRFNFGRLLCWMRPWRFPDPCQICFPPKSEYYYRWLWFHGSVDSYVLPHLSFQQSIPINWLKKAVPAPAFFPTRREPVPTSITSAYDFAPGFPSRIKISWHFHVSCLGQTSRPGSSPFWFYVKLLLLILK